MEYGCSEAERAIVTTVMPAAKAPAVFSAPPSATTRSRWSGDVEVRERLAPVDTILVLLSAAAFVAFPFLRSSAMWFAALLAAIAVAGWRRCSGPVVCVGGFGGFLTVASAVPTLMMAWPLPAAIAAVGLAVLTRATPIAASAFSFLRRGRLDPGVQGMVVGSALVAGTALLAWFELVRPDYAGVRAALFPHVSWPLLMAGVVLFAMVNGALEEIAYRGVLLDALDAAVGPGVLAIVLQAAAFGALHIGGFPRGVAGVALATTYGVMMGLVRRRSQGLLAPWLAHVLTDTVIGSILVATL